MDVPFGFSLFCAEILHYIMQRQFALLFAAPLSYWLCGAILLLSFCGANCNLPSISFSFTNSGYRQTWRQYMHSSFSSLPFTIYSACYIWFKTDFLLSDRSIPLLILLFISDVTWVRPSVVINAGSARGFWLCAQPWCLLCQAHAHCGLAHGHSQRSNLASLAILLDYYCLAAFAC